VGDTPTEVVNFFLARSLRAMRWGLRKWNEIPVLAGAEGAGLLPRYDVRYGERWTKRVKSAGRKSDLWFRITPIQARTDRFVVL
jgi:hypothetical protein